MDSIIQIGQKEIKLTNLEKMMWPEDHITKRDYIKYLIEITPYLLPYIQNRLMTTIRYPNGVFGKSFYQKNKPKYAPKWIETYNFENTEYMIVNNKETLIYLGNQACLEFHTSFHQIPSEEPTEMVFDLDPSIHDFAKVIEAALLIKEELVHLHLTPYVKTSGATGLQIYIPLQNGHTFSETRAFGQFLGNYLTQKYPKLFTIERFVKKRGNLIYFDYLQHWKGKTLIAPYSTRAHKHPFISTPLKWSEITKTKPEHFTIVNIMDRIKEVGDLFIPLQSNSGRFSLKPLLERIG